MSQLLSDEEITLIVRECAKGSAINRDGSTSHRIARAVIAACEAKLREQIKQLTAERDAYKEEWNGGLLTTPRSEILAENARLRDALTTIVDAQPKISAIELQIFARNVLKGL